MSMRRSLPRMLPPGVLVAIAALPRLIGRLRGSFAWIEPNELKRRLERGERVAVIDVRSSAAGFIQIKVLRRGMEQWNEAGLPVEGRAIEQAG